MSSPFIYSEKSLMEKDICPGPFTQWEAQRLPDPHPVLLPHYIITKYLFAFVVTVTVQ